MKIIDSNLNIRFVGGYQVDDIKDTDLRQLNRLIDHSIENDLLVCFDTEATGLDPHKHQVTMAQFGFKTVNGNHYQIVVDTRKVNITKELQKLSHCRIIGANLAFDYKMILNQYGVRFQRLVDIMVQEKVITLGIGDSYPSLKKMSQKYLNFDMPKDVRGEFQYIRTKNFNKRQIIYGAIDVLAPRFIRDRQLKLIKRKNLGYCINLENDYVKVVAEMEYNGMNVDSDKWMSLFSINHTKLIEAEKAIYTYILDNPERFSSFITPVGLFGGAPKVNINLASSDQLGKLLMSAGVDCRVFSKEGTKKLRDKYKNKIIVDDIDLEDLSKSKYETGSQFLSNLDEENDLVLLILEYKNYKKAVDAFGSAWAEKYIHSTTKRVHSSFNQLVNTGRLSSRNPNVQQIPAYKSPALPSYQAHRTCFVAPEGRDLIVRDYSGCELRILAQYSQEDSMINEFVNGKGDLHSLTAMKVFSEIQGKEIKVSKKENSHLRQMAKTLNFAISYGASGYKISKQLQIPEKEGQDIVDSFFTSFPKLEKYFSDGHAFIKENGYIIVDSITNRRSYFKDFKEYKKALYEFASITEEIRLAELFDHAAPKYPKELASKVSILRGKMERMSQNYRIQGTNASMTKIAMIKMYDYLYKNNLFDKVSIVLSLHDEIVLEACESISDDIDLLLCKYMLQAGEIFCPDVPMKVDGGKCKVWDH